jgi:hypothetical protein
VILLTYFLCRVINSLFHAPLPEEGPLPADLGSAVSEAPEAEENQDGDDVEISEDETSSMTSPPPALSEDLVVDKKGNVSKSLLL